MRDRGAGRERREQPRERLRVRRRVEPRTAPVTLEHDVIVATHDQRERAVLAGVARRNLECLRIELLRLRRHARRGRLVAAGNALARQRREISRPQQCANGKREQRDTRHGRPPYFSRWPHWHGPHWTTVADPESGILAAPSRRARLPGGYPCDCACWRHVTGSRGRAWDCCVSWHSCRSAS